MLDSLRIAFAAIGISASGVWMLSGSAQESYNFDLPASTVIERLNASRRTVEGTGMGSLTLSGEEQFRIGRIKIAVLRAGSVRKLFCTVAVEATSQTASRADIDCEQAGSDKNPAHQLAGQALRIVVEEHVVASALERPYDTDKVADRMIAFMARSAPVMAASMPSKAPPATPRVRTQPAFQDDEEETDSYGSAEPGYGEAPSEPANSSDAYDES